MFGRGVSLARILDTVGPRDENRPNAHLTAFLALLVPPLRLRQIFHLLPLLLGLFVVGDSGPVQRQLVGHVGNLFRHDYSVSRVDRVTTHPRCAQP